MKSPISRQVSSLLALSAALTLCGCNIASTPSDVDTFPAAKAASIAGTVHGGQFPIFNATVTIYAAGTTGYGSSGTALAQTTSDLSGNFSFTSGTANPSAPVLSSSWQCPVTVPASDPQIYITAIGGNTQGTGVTSTNNTASALMVALGPCSTINSSTTTNINEVSTAATVFALAQYINPSTHSIGTAAPNLLTSPAQSAVGLNNAVSTIANLANLSNGTPITANSYTGSNASVTGVTITATPESAKLITIANILAACINTPASTSNGCADLFSAAVPPVTAAVTSQPSSTFTAATDTIQAAYYMATNPADLSSATFTTCNDGGTTRISCLYALSNSSAPFQPGITTQPTDWTIGVNYTASGTCTDTGTFFQAASKEAVDAAGNLWFVNGGATGPATISELSPIGQPLLCTAPSTSFINGRGITIDPSGNVFASFDINTSNSIVEIPAGTSTATKWTLGVDGTGNVTALDIVSDPNGNIFYTTGQHSTPATGGIVFEYPVGSTSTTLATLMVNNLGSTNAAATLGYTATDPSGDIWVTSQTNPDMFSLTPNTVSITGYSIGSGNSVTFCTTTAPTYAIGQNVVVNGLTTGVILNHNGYDITSVTSTAPCTGNSFTGTEVQSTTLTSSAGALISDSGTGTGYSATTLALGTNSYGASIDSSNYVYSGTTCCAAGADKEIQRINPANTIFTASSAYLGGNNGIRGVAVDGAGNQWLTNVFPATGNLSAPGNYAISETYWTGTAFAALSPTGTVPGTCASSGTTSGCPTGGGFQKSSFLEALDIKVDPSGNVWVPNTGINNTSNAFQYTGTSITEIVGAAVPVASPLSVAAKNNKLGQKP